MSEMPHCLWHGLESKMMGDTCYQLRIKEFNGFLRNFVPNLAESRAHISGLKKIGDFGSRTELKMLMNTVDCTVEVNKCIQ